MQTQIHRYYFRLEEAGEFEEWLKLRAQLKASHPHVMEAPTALEQKTRNSWSMWSFVEGLDDQPIELETTHLFDNQWNTAPIGDRTQGVRLFDWALDVVDNPKIKCGYYLDQTAEMIAVRNDTLKCRYCGKQEPRSSGLITCPHCLDSEYLKEADVRRGLTRMKAISDRSDVQPLSMAEAAAVIPLYIQAQIHGSSRRGIERIAKKREALAAKRTATVNNANDEYNGLIWLLDHGINTDNVIYYTHTSRFSFGWRKELGEEETSALLDVITEFPFAYEIKTEKRGKLESSYA